METKMSSHYIINRFLVGLLTLALFVSSEPDVPAESLVGCYMDDSVNPDMGQPLNESQFYNMTRLNCACQCVDEGEPYAGVENGGYCYCGSSFGSYGESQCCSVPCTGDPAVSCGGYLAILVIKLSLIDSSTCGATEPPSTVPPTHITVLCSQSTMLESTTGPTSTDNLNSYTMTGSSEELNVTTGSEMTGTSFQTTDTSFQTDVTTSLMTQTEFTDVGTSWLTVSETTAYSLDFDSSSLGLELVPSTKFTIGPHGGSQSTASGKPDNALLNIDPCVAEEPDVQESDKIGTYKERQGTAVGYTCHPGLKFDAGGVSRSAICLDGQWLYIAPSCQEIECPPDCMIGGRALNLHQTVQVSCPPKQRFECGLETMNVTCFANGVAKMSPYSTCGHYCQPAPLLRNAVTVSNPAMREANVTCYPGYYFRDGTQAKVFTCNEDDIWQYDEHGCDEHNCPALSPPANGGLSSEEVAYGTVVTASCVSGFMFPDQTFTKTLACVQSDGGGNQWNATIEDCEEIFCKDWPPVLQNSAPSITSFSCPPYPYNSTFLYICFGGSRFEDGRTTAMVTCTGSGYWQTNVSSCGPDRCPEVPQLKMATADGWLATIGSVVTYTCQKGYRSSGQSAKPQTVCDGQRWSAVSSTCEATQCPVLQVPHGQTTSSARSVGSVVNANCDVAYMTEGRLSFTCSPTGQWNQSGESCRLVDCMMPPNIPNAYLVPLTDSPLTTTYGSHQDFYCMNGFWFSRMVRKATMECTVEGKWRMINRPDYADNGCLPNSCLPLFFHAVNTTDQIPGTIVNVSCDDGQPLLVSGLPSSLTTVCSSRGSWTPRVPDCLGPRYRKNWHFTVTEADGAQSIGIFMIFLVITASFIPVGLDLLHSKASRRNR